MKTVHFYPDLDITSRIEQLRKVCTTQVTKEYQRTLTESEIERDRFDYVSQAQTLANTKANAKASAESFKAEITGIETIMTEKLARIDSGKRKVNDALYGVPNYNNGQMEFFDRYGEMIESRRLTPDETTGQFFNNEGEATPEAGVNDVIGIEYVPPTDIEEAEYEEVKSSDDSDRVTISEEKPKKKRKTKAEKEAEARAAEAAESEEEEEEAPWNNEDEYLGSEQ